MKIKKSILVTYLFLSIHAFSQKKPISQTIQPFNISNIKLGMTFNEFTTSYKESIIDTIDNKSERCITYEKLIINNIECYNVLACFYKSKLYRFSFQTVDYKMHAGLQAKYGYADEYDNYDDDNKPYTVGTYGKKSEKQILLRQKKYDYEVFIMTDRITSKIVDMEGF